MVAIIKVVHCCAAIFLWLGNYDHHGNLNSNGTDYLAVQSTITEGASRDPGKQSGFGKCQRLQESLGGPGLEKGQ